MPILSQHNAFVKQQIAYYDHMAGKFRTQPDRQKLYTNVATKLRALLDDMENGAPEGLGVVQSSIGAPKQSKDYATFSEKLPANFFANPLALAPADYDGLEKDLLSELNITEGDKLDLVIVDLINAAGGMLILDKIIIGLFHLTGEKHQRVSMTARLYRMSKKNLVYSVPKRKGVYTTNVPDSDQQSLFDDLTSVGDKK